jgi:PKD repeat protein
VTEETFPVSRPRIAFLAVLSLLGSLLSAFVIVAPPAAAVQATQANVVNAVPATFTPDVNNGTVFSIGQVGATTYLGGTFTSVSAHGSATAVAHNFIAAFNASTGALDNTNFLPTVNGEVDSIIPGPAAGQVYIAGAFTTVDGKAMKVALLNTADGSLVSTWKPSAMNGSVNKVVLSNGTLFAGGLFTTVGGVGHVGLTSLNPTTGAVTNYVGLSFTGQHNYGTLCNPSTTSCSFSATGVKALDIDPSGTHMVVIGNFTCAAASCSGPTDPNFRDQIARVNLGATSATLDPTWVTAAFTAECFAGAYDSYIRDVQFSPDGSYFVVVATGGSGTNSDHTRSSCDSAARYETTGTGTDVQPTWIDYTGQDTFLSVAITGTVVYVGGHQRWVNNSLGFDAAGSGAVPRPGIVAFDPTNGMPFSWNPGRDPRGAGAYSLLATATGLYVGSDTDYIGPHKYLHKKIAYFPLAGGETLPASTTPALPGKVYTAGALTGSLDRLTTRHFDGSTAGAETTTATGIAWGSIRGAFTVNGEVIYGKSDGKLYERSINGTNFGAEVALDPYDDPTWDTVQTGSGQTYQSKPPNLFGTELAAVTSMFFTKGRLYYTVSGQTKMHWRWFEPESGVVGSQEFTTTDATNWSTVAGAFLSGNTLYFANKTTGVLQSIAWNGTQATGTATTLATGQTDWASRGIFMLDDASHPNQLPTAAFTPTCSSANNSCTFDASSSIDPDGSIADFGWDFGDGTGEHHPNSGLVTHTYTTAGPYSVTLTVTDNDGGTATKTLPVTAGQSSPVPTFKGATNACSDGVAACGKSTVTNVSVPSGTTSGDALLMFVASANTASTVSVPAGWHLLDRDISSPLESDVYYRVATNADVGTSVPVTFSAATKNGVTLADYSGVDVGSIEAYAKSADSATATHTTPTAAVTTKQSLAVSYWADKSSATTTWTLPADVRADSSFIDTGTAFVTSQLADSVSTVGVGSYGGKAATTNAASGKGTNWTVILAPAGTSPNQKPTASFTSNCTALACTFDGTGSQDPDGTIASYAWDFGDGATSTSPTPSHTFGAAGPQTVMLTVTDNQGATGTVTNTVTVSQAGPAIGFVGSNAIDGAGATEQVTVPAAASAGDALLLFESHASTTATTTAPSGWTLVGTTAKSNLTTDVYERVAAAADPGSAVTVTYSVAVPASLMVADYTNTAAVPIETSASGTSTGTSHITPALAGLSAGSWVVTWWSDKSTTTKTWTAPAAVVQRAAVFGTGSGADSALLADSAGPVSGSYAAQTATSSASSGSAAQWAVALAPAS